MTFQGQRHAPPHNQQLMPIHELELMDLIMDHTVARARYIIAVSPINFSQGSAGHLCSTAAYLLV